VDSQSSTLFCADFVKLDHRETIAKRIQQCYS